MQLNQGADSALVTAATRAGLASAPPDYSRTFEAMSAGYARTMQASSDMWNKIGTSAMGSYTAVKGTYKEQQALAGGVENLANGEELAGKVKGFRKELAGTKNLPGGYHGDEAKAARAEINRRKDIIYSFIESNTSGEQILGAMFNGTIDKKGNNIPASIDPQATGIYGMEVANAYAQSQNGGTTDQGNYFVPEEGKDGKMAWTMYHDENKVKYESKQVKNSPFIQQRPAAIGPEDKEKPTKPNGKPIMVDGSKVRYTIGEISEMMTQKDPNMKGLLNGIYGNAHKAGSNSGGNLELGKYQQNEMNDALEGIASNRSAWYQKTKYGEEGKSFHGELTDGVSVASANLFGQLSNVVAGGAETLESTGVLAGIDGMSDGIKGIQAADFQNEGNYKALTMTLFNPGNKNYDPEVTAGIFKEHTLGRIKEVQTHGWERSSKNPVNKPGYVAPNATADKSGFVPLAKLKNSDMFEGGGGDYVSEAKLQGYNRVGKAMQTRADMGDGKNAITWDAEKGSYFHASKGVIPNKASMFMYLGKGAKLTTTFKQNDFYESIKDWDGRQYLEKNIKKEDEGWKLFSPSTWF